MARAGRRALAAAIAAAALAATAAGTARQAMAAEQAETAGPMRAGVEEYRISCRVCHGPDGRGDGPMARLLSVRPADLTVLKKNNGGTFPFRRVFDIIDGRALVEGHGSREMPIWGLRFESQIRGDFTDYEEDLIIRNRVLELVLYLQEIQQ